MTLATRRSHLAYFSLGGTIASVASSGKGALVQLAGKDLLSGLPGVGQGADIEVFDFRQVPSGGLGMGGIIELARSIRDRIRAGADAVVISQGTDTLEETSYLLDLLI